VVRRQSNTAALVVLVGHAAPALLLPVIADALTVEVAALAFVDRRRSTTRLTGRDISFAVPRRIRGPEGVRGRDRELLTGPAEAGDVVLRDRVVVLVRG
jgi:hypothetical protein